ncbi:MAG: hypothetical protein ACLQU2_26765 [Candidatus Binataceae bacterium]
MAADQGKAEEHFSFEFETEKLGRVCCRPLNFKLLFRLTDLVKSAPDTAPDFVCALLSVVGERRDAAVSEDRAISGEQVKALTDQELEQFAARFLEAASWIGPGRTQPTSEGADQRSYGERLKRAFEVYEKGLAEHAQPYPLLDVFSDAVSSDSEHGLRLISGASIEAEKPAFWDPVKESFPSFWNGGLKQWHRAVGVAPAKFKSFFGNIGEKWQKPNGGSGPHIGESLATLGAVKQELVNREIPSPTLNKIGQQLEKIRGRLKTLRAEANEWASKVIYHRVLLGVVIIGLLSPMFFYLIVRANSRSQEVAAIRNLGDTLRSLSQGMDLQTKELAALAELIKKHDSEQLKEHDSEQRRVAQQLTQLDTKRQKGREKRPHHYSSLGGRHRQAL